MAPKYVVVPLAVSIAALLSNAYADSSKANNTTALNQAASWTNNTVPGATDIAIWDSNFTAASGTAQPQLGANTSWLGIKVGNVAGATNSTDKGVAVLNTNSANTLTIGAGGIDMSTATQTFEIQSKVLIGANQTWAVTNANTQVSTFTGLNNNDDLAFFAQASNAAFDLGGNTVTTSGNGQISFSSGYAISHGTFNISNPLFEVQGGSSRATTLASDLTLNVASGAVLHFQSTSGALTSDATINLNGGTLKLVSNNAGVNVTVNGTVAVNNPSTLNVGLNVGGSGGSSGTGTLNLNANLTGSADLNLTNTTTAGVTTANRLLIGGDNSGYSGIITLGAAGSSAGRVTRLTAATAGSAAATWNVAANHTLELQGVNVDFGTLNGNGTINSSTGDSTINVGAGNFTGTLANGAGTLALTKTGNGTLALTGVNTYTGATAVNGGTLLTTPKQTGTASVTVAPNATFGVSLVTTSTTFSTPSLVSNGTVQIATGALGNPTAPVIDAASFTPASATVIKVTGGALAPATNIPLIHYTGAIGGLGFNGLSLSLPFRTSGTLVDDSPNSRIALNITATGVPTWRGTANGNWDIDTVGNGSTGTANWLAASGPNTYVEAPVGTDSVVFDDTVGSGTRTVNITTTVSPISVTVNNSTAFPYTFAGPGKISGTATIAKSGNGTLIIANTTANDYVGGTTINSGTLQLGDGVTPGAGIIAGAITNNGTLVLNRPDDHTFSNPLFGTGTLQKEQSNTVTFAGSATIANLALNAGTVRFDAGAAINGLFSGSGTLHVSGSTVQLTGSGNNTFNATTNVTSGTLQLNKTGGNAIGGTINFTGTGGLTLSKANQIEDSTVINYDKAANGGSIIIGNETFGALNLINGNDSGAQFQVNNGFNVTGLVTAQHTSIFAVASGHSGSIGGLQLSNTPVVRLAANSGASTLNIGALGITASGGSIQVGQGTNSYDAVLNLGGDVTTTGNLSFSDGNFTGTQKREINLSAGAHTFNIGASTTTTIAPDIAGAGGIVKAGNGTLQLTTASASTYTGDTVISAGTLIVHGSLDGTAKVDISGILAGSGSIAPAPSGNVNLLAGGKLSPGQGAGTLGLTLSGGGVLDLTAGVTASNTQALRFELGTALSSDKISLAGGALKIGDGVLEFNDFSFTALAGFGTDSDYVLFDGDTAIDGTLGANVTGLIGGMTGELQLANGNTDLILHIPEPSTALALAGGLAMLALRRRRRS